VPEPRCACSGFILLEGFCTKGAFIIHSYLMLWAACQMDGPWGCGPWQGAGRLLQDRPRRGCSQSVGRATGRRSLAVCGWVAVESPTQGLLPSMEVARAGDGLAGAVGWPVRGCFYVCYLKWGDRFSHCGAGAGIAAAILTFTR
jgi:hypothetical protein